MNEYNVKKKHHNNTQDNHKFCYKIQDTRYKIQDTKLYLNSVW